MQIFSRSHTRSSSGRSSIFRACGFTLVELLVSIAIITIVSAIVLVKYSAFDSTVLLKGAAYEIALALRESQIKSVSVARSGSNFDYPYGMTFTPNTNTYTSFEFLSAIVYPKYGDPLANDVFLTTMNRSMYVSDICVTSGGSEICRAGGLTRLDISFRRPEFNALFYATRSSGTDLSTSITDAKVKVSSTKGNGVFVVEVTALGQVSIYKE